MFTSMKFKTKTIRIDDLKVLSSDFHDFKIIIELTKHIGRESLKTILALHPIFLHEITPNVYRIISGEQQLRLARALLRTDDSISVEVLIDDSDCTIATLTESIIAPLLFSVSHSELRARAKAARKDPLVFRLGRNFNLDSTWNSLLSLLREERADKGKQAADLTQSGSESSEAAPKVGKLGERSEKAAPEKT